jgi:hypothetical protein
MIAARRGDTNDVGKFDDGVKIDVLIPEAVHCNPISEHGDGDSFMNSLEDLINISDSTTEAGLLVVMSTAQKIK